MQVGASLTEYAGRIFRAQCVLFLQEQYELQEEGAQYWRVTNEKSGRVYQISQQQNGAFVCSCYVSTSFGIACRHALLLRRERHECLFDIVDFLPRWHRGNPAATSDFDIFDDVARAAFDGIPDENVLDDQRELAPVDSAFRYDERGVRFKSVCDRAKLLASILSNFGAKEFKERLVALDHFVEIVEHGGVPLVCLPNACDVSTDDIPAETSRVRAKQVITRR